jgi:hypothetical protein
MELNDFLATQLTRIENKLDNLTNNVITKEECKKCGKTYNLKLITTISTIISGIIGAIVVILVKLFKIKL